MATKMAVCPDGMWRVYTVKGELATVQVGGRSIEGRITEADGVTRFRQSAHHHGAHLMYYPARPV